MVRHLRELLLFRDLVVNLVVRELKALYKRSVLANLVNFLLALLVLFVVMALVESRLSPWIWLLPLVILVQTCFILGIPFVLSTVNVFYRDTLMLMNVVMLAWFLLTPIIYPVTMLPRSYEVFGHAINVQRWLYILNPLAPLVAAYRDMLYWEYRTNLYFLFRTAVTSLVVFGFWYWFLVWYRDRFGERI